MSRKARGLIVGLITLFILLLLGGVLMLHVFASQGFEHDNHNHPTPTPTPNVCRETDFQKSNNKHRWCSVEPTVAPATIPSPTPTIDPCFFEFKTVDIDCVTPTLTPTPTATSEATPTPEQGNGGTPPTFTGSSTEAPKPGVCTLAIEAPKLQGFKVTSPTSVFWSWWPTPSNIVSQWIDYGYSEGNYPYSQPIPVLNPDGTKTSGYEIGSLALNLPRWARLGVMNDQGCVSYSDPLDP